MAATEVTVNNTPCLPINYICSQYVLYSLEFITQCGNDMHVTEEAGLICNASPTVWLSQLIAESVDLLLHIGS